MNYIKLSICIPTYNRAQVVCELIREIFKNKARSFEIVVLDNGSTDDTYSILHAIEDDRLKIYRNEENRGGLYNVVNVIDKARGKFILFSTDKDSTNPVQLTKFIDFLFKNPGLASGYCAFDLKYQRDYEIYPKGYQAVKNIAYKGRHPTGYFFNNKMLKSIKHVERFSDFKIVGMFPFEFIHAELCMLGSGAIYRVPMFTLETEGMAAKHKSYNVGGKSKEAFFSPDERLKLAINYTKHIDTLQLEIKERKLLKIDVFYQQLIASTFWYRAMLANNNICAHYRMEPQKIQNKMLLKIGLEFYTKYRAETIGFWGPGLIEKLTFETYLIRKIWIKAFCYIMIFFKKKHWSFIYR